MESRAKNAWQLRLVILGIFIVGFIAGALAMNLYRERQRPSSPGGMRARFEQVLERLDLTGEQKDQVRVIFDEARSRITDIREESSPKFREVRRQTDERLQAVLTPAQWERFQQLMKDGRGRRRRDGGPRSNEP